MVNDRVYFDDRLAELLSVDASTGAAGLPAAQMTRGIHADDRDVVGEKIRQAVECGGEYCEEYRTVQADGEVRWVLARGRCHLDAQGRAIRFPGVIFDVTERHNQAREMLQTAKLESLGVMAGGIAHDFNNLLTGIMGNASLLEGLVSDAHRPFAEQVLSASEKAAHLTRQMLAYSGRGHFESTYVNLSQQVREIFPLIKPSLGNAMFTLNLADDLPTIRADAGQIQSILMNLVTNAAEAAVQPGGTVMVATSAVEISNPDEQPHRDRRSHQRTVRPA